MSRKCFADDETLKQRVFELLETAFPGIGACAGRIVLEGGKWEQVSTPFVKGDAGGKVIAHVGVLPLPVIIAGQKRRIYGVHAVCTDRAHRGKGHMRELMAEMLAWAGEETAVLFTSEPGLYERFGFRVVQEHRFEVAAQSPGGGGGFRALHPQQADGRRLLVDLLNRREPVSQVFGIQSEERGVFSYNCPDEGLWYCRELDVVAWMEMEQGTLRVYDIVAQRVPRMREILGHWPARVERVETFFAPDRLDVAGRAMAHGDDGYFMARGSFEAEGRPFMVPRTGRC